MGGDRETLDKLTGEAAPFIMHLKGYRDTHAVVGLLILAMTGCGSSPQESSEPRRETTEMAEISAVPELPGTEPAVEEPPGEEPPREPALVRLSQSERRIRNIALRDARLAEDPERALELLETALSIDPTNATLLCAAGEVATRQDDSSQDGIRRLQLGASTHRHSANRAACAADLGEVLERRANAAVAAGADPRGFRGEAIGAYDASLGDDPDNEQVRGHFLRLLGQEFRAYCGKSGAFSDLDTFCGHQYIGGEEPTRCEPLPTALPLVRIVEVELRDRIRYHAVMQHQGLWHTLGVLGESLHSTCASLSFEVIGVQWMPGTASVPTLLIDTRLSGQNLCGLSEWDRCIIAGDAACADDTDVLEAEETHHNARFACAVFEGRYRCTRPPRPYGDPTPQALDPFAPPEDLDPHLTCSVFLVSG